MAVLLNEQRQQLLDVFLQLLKPILVVVVTVTCRVCSWVRINPSRVCSKERAWAGVWRGACNGYRCRWVIRSVNLSLQHLGVVIDASGHLGALNQEVVRGLGHLPRGLQEVVAEAPIADALLPRGAMAGALEAAAFALGDRLTQEAGQAVGVERLGQGRLLLEVQEPVCTARGETRGGQRRARGGPKGCSVRAGGLACARRASPTLA